VYFNFFGELVEVSSDWDEILKFLKKDFSYFVTTPRKMFKKSLKLQIYQGSPLKMRIPEISSKMQSLNSITYQAGSIRYNDYYGKLLSIFNYETENCEIFSNHSDKTHEVAYLLILSRIGKRLDLLGLHKLHAFAISYLGHAFVCMMPMKGGKSTLLLELLKYDGVKMISDDIPLVNFRGQLIPFPIKIGIDKIGLESLKIEDSAQNVYMLKREHYGEKIFVSVDGVKEKIETQVFSKIILAEGFRFHSEKTTIRKASWIFSFIGLFKHGVIGFGLPMILEYFWEFGVLDFLVKTRIFFQRLFAFVVFNTRAYKVSLKIGTDSKMAAEEILKMIKTRSYL
jgi:hypothetical protein